ncbi:hypothetical protein [Methanobacterium spitsbergense]|uniref:Uncharacterized protein n=1 Tax=Methanobacterium spitsbergense TaxID=2874285 RepID=A0A8T5UTF9_9EURY|nr:hypothetical protein [Methanobacterium spitsbergense]MBZ2166994.1 hypothetical protein [Methanobacterium spitsbergense]
MIENSEPETIYDELFKDKKFALPQNKHERPIRETELQKIKDKETGEIKKIEVNTYGECIECGYPLVALDHHRAERICECGMTNKKIILLPDTGMKKERSKQPLRTSKNTGYTPEEAQFLNSNRKRRGPKVRSEKQDWKKSQHIFFLGTIKSQLLMNYTQEKRVKEIINNHSLHLIHSRVDARTVIAGICRYILLQDGRGKELRYNRSAFKFVGLNEFNYNVIERNLKRLGF